MKHGHSVRFGPALAALAVGVSAEAQTATAPAEGGSGVIMAVGLVLALLVVIGAAVKVFDLKRKREAEAVYLQAQVSDALLRQEDLFGLPVTATAHVPMWSGTPVTIEVSGQVPTPELHDRVLRIVLEEVNRIRPDVEIEDRMSVVPTMAARVA
jgi:hypothetical protein